MTVDRRRFTPGGINPPCPVPLSHEQTVPTEQMVNLLADLCGLTPESSVLEIGTGSGYQAAVLAERCKEVVTIEARPVNNGEKIAPNVYSYIGDGTIKAFTHGEFDAVLVTCATPKIFPAWRDAVRSGGRIVAPIETGGSCAISVFYKLGDELILHDVPAYAPFTSLVRTVNETTAAEGLAPTL